MNKLSPLVSIVMPVKDSELYLEEAITSILSQTYQNFELIIIDDGSTDSTLKIIKSINDSRVRLIHNNYPGVSGALNKGISQAKGIFLARMDSDDISYPNRLSEQVEYLINNQKESLVFSTVELIDQYGNHIGNWEDDIKNTTPKRILNTLAVRNCLAHPSLLIKTSLIRKYLYDSTQLYGEDYDLWLRLASSGYSFNKISSSLLKYRVHPNSITVITNKSHGIKKIIQVKTRYLLNQFHFNFFNLRTGLYLILGDIPIYLLFKIKEILFLGIMQIIALMGMIIGRSPIKGSYHSVLFFPFYHTGGAEKVHLEIIRSIDKHKNLVIVTEKSNNDHYLSALRKSAEVLDLSRSLANPFLYCYNQGVIAKFINNSNTKIIFGANCSFYYRMLPFITTNKIKIDLIHGLGAGVETFSLPFVSLLNKRVVITRSIKDQLLRLYKQHEYESYNSRILVINNSVNIPKITHKPANNFDVVFISRNSPEKRVYLFYEIAKRFSKIYGMNFIIVGDHNKTSMSGNVQYAGEVLEGDRLNQILQAAHIILSTSTREGFPISVMEAMSFGVIPICTNVGGLSDHITGGSTGYLIDNKAEQFLIDDFVKTIGMLYSNQSLRSKISNNAYNYAVKHFSPELFKSSYQRLFNDIR